MKNWVLLFALLVSVVSFSQTEETPCSTIPVARPEIKAGTDLSKLNTEVKNNLSTQVKKGEHSVTFKLIIDCKGAVSKTQYHSGSLTETEASFVKSILEKTTWTPAQNKGVNVTSTLFVTVKITNGKPEVSIY